MEMFDFSCVTPAAHHSPFKVIKKSRVRRRRSPSRLERGSRLQKSWAQIVDCLMWARFGVVAFSVYRHVCDVAYSTSHKPTRSGMEPDVRGKSLIFLCGYVWGVSDGLAGRHPGTWLVQIFHAAVRWISAQRNRNRSFLLIRRLGGIMGKKLIAKAAAIGRPMG